jgi:non-ribosomal peptide synthetase component F
MSMNYETPYDIQERLKRERLAQAQDGQAAEQRAAESERQRATYTPPKDPANMTPVELEKHRADRAAADRTQAAEHAERLMKDKLRAAFLKSGGGESDFDAAYPALRQRFIQDETMEAIRSEPSAGARTSTGEIRW